MAGPTPHVMSELPEKKSVFLKKSLSYEHEEIHEPVQSGATGWWLRGCQSVVKEFQLLISLTFFLWNLEDFSRGGGDHKKIF